MLPSRPSARLTSRGPAMSVKIGGEFDHSVSLFIDSLRKPGLRYKVLEFDPDTQQAKLIGAMGTEFSRNISKPELEKYGYKRTREIVNAEQS